MSHNEHFRITMVDGWNGLTYVKDCTRDCQILGVMQECAEGKLLEDMGPNGIEEIRIERLHRRTEQGDVVRAYREASTVRIGSEIMLERDGVWSRVRYSRVLEDDDQTHLITLEYQFSDGKDQYDIKVKGTELVQVKLRR